MSEVEVFIAPMKIFWVEAPPNVKKKEKIDFLQQDVLLIPCKAEYLIELKDKDLEKTVILIDFDNILTKMHDLEFIESFQSIKGFVKLIVDHFSKIAIFHTLHINQKIEKDIKKLGLIYLERNLEDMKLLKRLVTGITNKFFNVNNIKTRSFLRVQFYPASKIVVKIRNITKKNKDIKGTLKDLSINGIGIIFNTTDEINQFSSKDLLQLKIIISNSVINIRKSIVIRVDEKKNEIGIAYNSEDHEMVSEHDAFALTEIVHKYLEEILNIHGKDFDLNFVKIDV